jgi:TatD DNase family protein
MGKKRREIPVYDRPIIETHCHLDYLKRGTPSEVVEEAKKYGVEKFITIGVRPDNLDSVIEMIEEQECVYGTQGIHPHDAKFYTEEVKSKIISNSNHQKVLAIGEIGLDYYYQHSTREEQISAFRDQYLLAIERQLPVVIHTRDADQDTLEILEELSPSHKQKGVVHSFTSGLELAKRAVELGFYLGFNGIITFKNAENVRDALRQTPLESILVETDAPFLTPIPYRGVENTPAYLPFILEKIAEIKEVSIEKAFEKTYQNAKSLFQIA